MVGWSALFVSAVAGRTPRCARRTCCDLVMGSRLALGDESGLVSGVLVKRYKRFLADIVLDGSDDADAITCHCANPGRMNGYSDPGTKVYCSRAASKTRKLPYTWEIAQVDDVLVGVNTHNANKLVGLALQDHRISALARYDKIRREVKVTHKSHSARVDFMLEDSSSPEDKPVLLEVKSVTMGCEDTKGLVLFPDAVSVRARDHVRLLALLAQKGKHRCVLLFCVQRSDAVAVAPADHIDPEFCTALREAIDAGVEVLAMKVVFDDLQLAPGELLPFHLDKASYAVKRARKH